MPFGREPQPDRGSICAHLIVKGRVQGVWYRGSARAEARALGLSGWARNRADGSVEIVVQGPPGKIERFVQWCRRGPAGARVASVDRIDRPADANLREFEIRVE